MLNLQTWTNCLFWSVEIQAMPVNPLSWQEECCQALPPGLSDRWWLDELSYLWDLHAVMPAPMPLLVWPLPSLPHPRLYGATPCTGPAGCWELFVGGGHSTYFGVACQPACSMGICKHYRTHPLRWMLANLGCGQSHVGQQPMSVCMCVRVSSSIWANGLQYGMAAMTIRVEDWTVEW